MMRKDYLSLPDDPRQCIHLDVKWGEEIPAYCPNLSDGRCGWLCRKHDSLLLNPRVQRGLARLAGDEVVAHILAVDGRAMTKGHREAVRVGVKGEFITYLVG